MTEQMPTDPTDVDAKYVSPDYRTMQFDLDAAIRDKKFEDVASIMKNGRMSVDEILDFMDIKRSKSADAEELSGWSRALSAYLDTLNEQELQGERASELMTKKDILDFCADLRLVEEGYDYPKPDGLYDESFEVPVDQEEIDRLSLMSEFTYAKSSPETLLNVRSIEQAIERVNRYSPDETKDTMLKMIDMYTYQLADYLAGNIHYPDGLSEAIELIDKLGSCDETRAMMRASLDKYIIEKAIKYASGQLPSRSVSDALSLIKDTASTPERVREMNYLLSEFYFEDIDRYA